MPRTVLPELLDTLPPDAPEAQASRADLHSINRWMRNLAWFRRVLKNQLRPDDRVLELGAGDGVLRHLAPVAVPWDAIDFAPPPADWPTEARWHRADFRTFSGWADYTVIIGNLVFHHLQPSELVEIGGKIRRHARLVLASEPTRSRRAQAGFRLLCAWLRAHPVTRHDGRVSIDAGFRGRELSNAL
ncbi:MAG TPA: hypothetical protein VHF69_03100, partial [Candidatus Synoicihabitans sp.]|nr:hypothetical protein [Candidatus Synoicihabitans sp.]